MYDLIIIGGGPAGITAAIYAARRKLNFLVVALNIGGQAIQSVDVENYPGFHLLDGKHLIKKFKEHMDDYDIKMRLREQIVSVRKIGKLIRVKTTKSTYKAKAVIIASGKEPRTLDVPGEKRLKGKGVSYCLDCDIHHFKDKNAAIVGGGNSALESAEYLRRYATNVYLITINKQLSGDAMLKDKIKNAENIKIFYNAKTKEILGDKRVKAIKIIQNKQEVILNIDGVFVEIGLKPGCDFSNVEKNKKGEIKIKRSTELTKENMTSIPGIFAAGDVTDVPEKYIVVACGEGAKALIAASSYISKKFP